MNHPASCPSLFRQPRAWLIGALLATTAWAQTAPATKPAEDSEFDPDKVFVLSPFQVDASKDSGYRATNSISGTRLNTPLKDVPMPIEIITNEFIKDTGAQDLRQALAYSAGVVLTSQGDFGRGVDDLDDGAEGVTGTKEQTSIKLRGFATTEALRRGFRRASYTDAIAVERVEVVRGPSALLYGIGNFGGIVNYLPKEPQLRPKYQIRTTAGSWDYLRGDIDFTSGFGGQWGKKKELAYRLVAAADETKDWTEFKDRKTFFVMPAVSFKPFKDTRVLVDLELGASERNGIGFLSPRASDAVFGSAGRKETGFLPTPGYDRRTFRWSGPDTYLNENTFNSSIEVTQKLTENLDFLIGAQITEVQFDRRDVRARLDRTTASPVALRRVVSFQPQGLFPRIGVSAALAYIWLLADEDVDTDQARAELNYRFKLGKSSHNLLFGTSMLERTRTQQGSSTRSFPSQTYNWKAVDDYSYFRYDPANQVPITVNNNMDLKRWDQGAYLVYQGKYFRDRLQILGGVRHDRADAATVMHDLATGAVTSEQRGITGEATKKWSPQIGASYALTNEVSVFALRSTGLTPNDDKVDGAGVPFVPTKAVSLEAGFKVDLFDGKISGTASVYHIKRTDAPQYFWYAPAPYRTTLFDPTRPISYAPYFNNVPYYENNPADYALLKTLFDSQYAPNVTAPPPYYFYNGGSATNFPPNGAYAPLNDESKGFDAQIILTPTKAWQIVLGYAHVKRTVTLGPKLVKATTYSEFAVYYANAIGPVGRYGFGPATEHFSDPKDTSTYDRSLGVGLSFDDTPTDTYTLWNNYKFEEGFLKGAFVGTGVRYEGARDYSAGGLTVDGGINYAYTNPAGTASNADRYEPSRPKYSVDLLLGYGRKFGKHYWDLRLNVFNLLDDQKLYGDIFNAPRSMRLSLGVTF